MTRRLCLAIGSVAITAATASAATASAAGKLTDRGRDLFEKAWSPFDPEAAPGGDGLGPFYNDVSCVGCHHQGGVGGAGPIGKNVVLGQADDGMPFLIQHQYAVLDLPLSPPPLRRAERNPAALFGVGVLDAIPDIEIVMAADNRDADHIERVGGRVSWTSENRVGRFGWKGQTASLEHVVAHSCAVELGLEVTGHTDAPRSPVPRLALDLAHRLAANALGSNALIGDEADLSDADLSALVGFVRELPRPRELADTRLKEDGERIFHDVGCDDCHTVDLAGVRGLYSDLLLHNMGGRLAEGASAEWRTPPLWGLSVSGPYLHDGRASGVEDAIVGHGGQGEHSAALYFGLSDADRTRLNAFLAALPGP